MTQYMSLHPLTKVLQAALRVGGRGGSVSVGGMGKFAGEYSLYGGGNLRKSYFGHSNLL